MKKTLTATIIMSLFSMTSLSSEHEIGDYIRKRQVTKPVRIGLGIGAAVTAGAAGYCSLFIKNEKDKKIVVGTLFGLATILGISAAATE